MPRLKRDVSATVRADVLDAGACRYCGDRMAELEVEHYVPLARGGTNERDNLVAACISCNTQKGTMLFSEWRAYRQTHGMPWPPIASHPTELRHYGDVCNTCRDLREDRESPRPEHGWIYLPYYMAEGGPGKMDKGYYRCAAGHRWTCCWGLDKGYYSDCACSYCHNAREDFGEKHWPDTRLPSVVGT